MHIEAIALRSGQEKKKESLDYLTVGAIDFPGKNLGLD